MQKLRVIAVSAMLCHGKVRLSERQAHDRAHQLRALDEAGTYQILSPITFKAGEEFEFDGPINKLQLATLEMESPEGGTPPNEEDHGTEHEADHGAEVEGENEGADNGNGEGEEDQDGEEEDSGDAEQPSGTKSGRRNSRGRRNR